MPCVCCCRQKMCKFFRSVLSRPLTHWRLLGHFGKSHLETSTTDYSVQATSSTDPGEEQHPTRQWILLLLLIHSSKIEVWNTIAIYFFRLYNIVVLFTYYYCLVILHLHYTISSQVTLHANLNLHVHLTFFINNVKMFITGLGLKLLLEECFLVLLIV